MASSFRLLLPRGASALSSCSKQLQAPKILRQLQTEQQPSPFAGAIRRLTTQSSRPQFLPQANTTTSKLFQPRRCLHKLAAEQNPTPLGFFSRKNSTVADATATAAATAKEAQQQQAQAAKADKYPDVSHRSVACWLLGSAGLVFCIVVVGGLTRLTESGLSITQWKPITGALPPRSQSDWEREFTLYRSSPEFRLLNPTMSLDEYKFIYYMEWSHRLLGRLIGISFVLPALYFTLRRRVSRRDVPKLALIAVGIGIQGVIGWWMVQSGLGNELGGTQVENFDETGGHPRVSQYRLTAHLGAAFIVYAGMVSTALSILRDRKLLIEASKSSLRQKYEATAKLISTRLAPRFRAIRFGVGLLTLLTFTTAMSGALVAGLDAGLVYNEFPTMAGGDTANPYRIIPPYDELFNPIYSHAAAPPHDDLIWQNMLENPVTVQLQHRILATTTFTYILGLFLYTRMKKDLMKSPSKRGAAGVLHVALLQVALGISTLVYMVPTELAAAHQAGSLALFTMCLLWGSRIWAPKGLMRLLAKKGIKVDTRASQFVKNAGKS